MKQLGYSNSSYNRMVSLALRDRYKQSKTDNDISELDILSYNDQTLERFFKMHEELIKW